MGRNFFKFPDSLVPAGLLLKEILTFFELCSGKIFISSLHKGDIAHRSMFFSLCYKKNLLRARFSIFLVAQDLYLTSLSHIGH